jgi:cobalt-zinc-cadmium efflux system outer membrane protein
LLTPIRHISLTLLLCGLGAGCVRFHPEPLSPEQSANTLEKRSLADPGLRKFIEENLHHSLDVWPPRVWDFPMLTLAALYYHPDLEAARAESEVARAGIKTAGGRPNPTLNATPALNFSHVNAPAGLSPWMPFFDIDLPIETFGKRGRRIAAARHLSEAAQLNLATTAWRARAKVRESLLDFVAAHQRAELLQKQVETQERIIALVEQQIRAGAAAEIEAIPFRLALQKNRLDTAESQRLSAEARGRLAAAIGIPVHALDGVKISFDLDGNVTAADGLTTATIRRQALLGRTDILSALADYAASEATLQLEIARQYPDVHFAPGYQFDQGDNLWSVGLTVELPILNQNQGPIAEAKARRIAAAARFNAAQATALAEIDIAVESFRATEKNAVLLRELADGEAKSRDAIAAQVKAGAAAPLDLLNAQLEFAVAEMGQWESRVKLQQSVAALEDAVQHPMEEIKP